MELSLQERIDAFARLSNFMIAVANKKPELLPDSLLPFYERFQELIPKLYDYNGWFIEDFVRYQLNALGEATKREKLEKWTGLYPALKDKLDTKVVAVIMAGNIPFVGFQDFISVLMAGYKFLGKLSSKDKHLPRSIAGVLCAIEPRFEGYIIFTEERLNNFSYDAVIATGSDNSARYFEYYFGKYPNIIRRNRTSVAVLDGSETKGQLEALADDVFLYFGLGCRNVSKIFLPQGFDLNRLFEAFFKYAYLIDFNKYANNYEYNRAIYLLNREKFFDNGFVLLKPDDLALVSPTAVVYYQHYSDLSVVPSYLEAYRDKIQCVVSSHKFEGFDCVDFGQSQKPELWQYADNVDVMEFLLNLQ